MIKFKHNPLANCKLRIAGLKSVKGAMFGMTRINPNGTPRAHQGIDLASDIGYRCYAVEKSTVVGISIGKDGYGYTVTLKLDCPEKKELHNKFVFYAHLKLVDVNVGQKVEAGYVIGLTGDTGNAKGMTTKAKGGHLHFELRIQQVCGKGITGRIDPLLFIKL